jgi:hypothetical protein
MKKNTTHAEPHAHHHHLGQTASTILLAIAFLSVVMLLSYLFSSGIIGGK